MTSEARKRLERLASELEASDDGSVPINGSILAADLRSLLDTTGGEGWRLAPVEATPVMLHAGFGTADGDNAWRYRAMIEAAPSPPSADEGGGK